MSSALSVVLLQPWDLETGLRVAQSGGEQLLAVQSLSAGAWLNLCPSFLSQDLASDFSWQPQRKHKGSFRQCQNVGFFSPGMTFSCSETAQKRVFCIGSIFHPETVVPRC